MPLDSPRTKRVIVEDDLSSPDSARRSSRYGTTSKYNAAPETTTTHSSKRYNAPARTRSPTRAKNVSGSPRATRKRVVTTEEYIDPKTTGTRRTGSLAPIFETKTKDGMHVIVSQDVTVPKANPILNLHTAYKRDGIHNEHLDPVFDKGVEVLEWERKEYLVDNHGKVLAHDLEDILTSAEMLFHEKNRGEHIQQFISSSSTPLRDGFRFLRNSGPKKTKNIKTSVKTKGKAKGNDFYSYIKKTCSTFS